MNELLFGLFFAMSSGLGFQDGLGMELGYVSPKLEVIASATSSRKYEDDWGYTYSVEGTYFVPIHSVAFGIGCTYYGYQSLWSKSFVAPTYSFEWRPGKHSVRAFYIAEDEEASAAVGLQGYFESNDNFGYNIRAVKTLDYDGWTADVGVHWRF